MLSPLRSLILVLLLVGIGGSAGSTPALGQNRQGPFSSFADHVGDLSEGARPFLVRVVRPTVTESADGTPEIQIRLIGSGVSLGQGYIMTAATVAGPMGNVSVVSIDGQEISARVVGVDRRTNIAVLHAAQASFPAAPVARIPLLFPGALVLAAGIGPQTGPEASFGNVILMKGPSLGLTGADMVQVTAPAFDGMTGGALLNREGELVGLISGWMQLRPEEAIVPPGTDLVAGFVQNHSLTSTTLKTATLAVPVLRALDVADELIEKGFVERGYLGLRLELTPADADPSRHLRGVMVHGVVSEGPASSAGLIPGDVILEYAGASVANPSDLNHLVSASLPGASVMVRFLRKGRREVTMVHIQQAPELEWTPGLDAWMSAQTVETGVAPNLR